MRDDQRQDQDKPEECFEDALDDLFGDAPDEDASTAEPSNELGPVEPPAALVQPEPLARPPGRSVSEPVSQPEARPASRPRSGGRNLRRIGCIVISAVVGAILLCVVILAVIGFIVGDPATPTPVV